MKSLYFICFLFLLSLHSKAQWVPTSSANQQNDSLPHISKVSFINAASGIAACRSVNPYQSNGSNIGSIMTTNDSAVTWTYRLEVDSFYFQDIIHANLNIALAIGSHRNYNWTTFNEGILARSADAGRTWDTTFFPYHLNSIEKINDSVLFIAGTEYFSPPSIRTVLLKSIDEGINWIEIPNSYSQEYITDVDFVTDSIGFMTGINSKVYRTVDQGASWTTANIDSTQNYKIHNITIPSLSNLYVITDGGTIHNSSDTGSTWNKLATPSGGAFYKIAFVNDSIGYVAGFGISKTTDSGMTWNNQSFALSSNPSLHSLTEIIAISPTTLYSAGPNQFFRTFFGGEIVSHIQTNNSIAENLILAYPSPTERFITIPFLEDVNRIEIIDIRGKEVYSTNQISTPHNKIELHVKNGIYLVKLIFNDGSIRSAKIIKV